eukprot:3913119-Rhodomonas_salina.5
MPSTNSRCAVLTFGYVATTRAPYKAPPADMLTPHIATYFHELQTEGSVMAVPVIVERTQGLGFRRERDGRPCHRRAHAGGLRDERKDADCTFASEKVDHS